MGVSCTRPPGGEAADEVDDRARATPPAAPRDLARRRAASKRSACDELEAVAPLDALELALGDPRHDDAPAVVQQRAASPRRRGRPCRR